MRSPFFNHCFGAVSAQICMEIDSSHLPHRGDHQRLADIFVQKGPYLKMYSTYIRQFDNNVALLDEQCRKNPGFAAVVREFEVQQEVCVCVCETERPELDGGSCVIQDEGLSHIVDGRVIEVV